MKRRLLLACALAPLVASAAPPAVTLLVELRWVDSQLPPAAQAGVRDGAVVVGTAGSVSPRGTAVVTSTAPAAAPQPGPRLLVLNGQRASLVLTTLDPLRPLQPMDVVAELDAKGGVRGLYARPQVGERESRRSVTVTPTWPGGRALVRVEFQVDGDGGAFQSTLDLPLERWQAVARTGGGAAPAPRGSLSSADAAGQPARELQLRVSLQP